MIIKRYLVSSMNEAMTRIRYELGKDAVIISQRKVKKPGIAGLFSKRIIEVTAAVENINKKAEENKKLDDDMANSIEALKKAMEKDIHLNKKDSIDGHLNKKDSIDGHINKRDSMFIEKKNSSSTLENKEHNEKQINDEISITKDKVENVNIHEVSGANADLMKEVQEMKSLLNDMMNKTPDKGGTRKSKLQTKLESADISEKVAKKIVTKVKSIKESNDEEQNVRTTVESIAAISKAKMEGKVILVGPTGVGKTTTIAKLAGRLSLIENKKVGLITIDTYRIGAVEQLKTYADIMNLPFKVVFTIKEMEVAVEALSDCDTILIDTTGRSSKNTMQISELRAFIEKVGTKNIHLVLSCTTKNKDIENIIEGYKMLNYNNIIITKLDETTTYGSILNILDAAKKPLSFVTTGQNVPDDIKKLTSAEVANLVLGEDGIC